MALLSDGGYSLSCAVWKVLVFLLVSLMRPIVNLELVVGLWHVVCLLYRFRMTMSLSILEM